MKLVETHSTMIANNSNTITEILKIQKEMNSAMALLSRKVEELEKKLEK